MEPNDNVNSMIAGAEGLIKKVPEVAKVTPEVIPAAPATTTVAPAVMTPVTPTVKPVVNAPLSVTTPLGTQVYGGTPLDQVNLTSFADVKAFAKDFLGAELKEVKDLVSVFNELKQAKEQAVKTAELQKIVDNFTSTLNNLPVDVALILNAAVSGEDHLPIIQKLQKKSALDFGKPFESQDQLKLVNHYTGRQYTKDVFDALDEGAKNALTDSVKLKFDADRNELVNFETNTKKATEQRQREYQASVESSIATMLAGNPQMGKAAVDRVRQIMLYGIADVLFTKDKTYVPEAATKIAMMEYGKEALNIQAQTIGDLAKKIANQTASETTEKILLRSDKPPVAGAAPDQNLVASIVARATSFLPKKQK